MMTLPFGMIGWPLRKMAVIRAWKLGFCLGNCVKYVSRAGKKDPLTEIEDLRKAAWYLNEEIETRLNEAARELNK